MLFPPPSTSQTTPCSRPTEPKAVGVRVRFDTHRLYCNAVLANLPDSALAPLQQVLHAAARFVADLGPRDHVTSTLVSLHWLPIRQRITYELCTMMHSVWLQCIYLTLLLQIHISRAVLTYDQRKMETTILSTPRVLSSFGQRSFVLGVWTRRLEQGFSGA